MSGSAEEYFIGVMSGRRRGVGAGVLRGATRVVEPVYAGVVTARNALWDRGIGVKRLGKPVVSVGNITAGGTGKTPVVRWLCERLLEAGRWPAVLSRGYKTADEPAMLGEAFGRQVVVGVNPNRFEEGQRVLAAHPNVNAFVLDDGFQHRKLHRDFDLVLINAAEPFGFGHVHPRGLLREPLRGLRRASAVLLTHADAVDAGRLAEIEAEVRRHHAGVEVFRSVHVHTGLRSAGCAARESPNHRMEELKDRRVMVVSGIGDPERFEAQMARAGNVVARVRRGDHAAYTSEGVREIDDAAKRAGADVIVTTEKDWGKMRAAGGAETAVPVWRVELAIRFWGEDEGKLFKAIGEKLEA